MNLVSETKQDYKEQIKTKLKTLLPFPTRHVEVWTSGCKHHALLFSVLYGGKVAQHWIQDWRDAEAVLGAAEKVTNILTLPYVIPQSPSSPQPSHYIHWAVQTVRYKTFS